MLVLETGEDEHLNPLTRWGYFFPSVRRLDVDVGSCMSGRPSGLNNPLHSAQSIDRPPLEHAPTCHLNRNNNNTTGGVLAPVPQLFHRAGAPRQQPPVRAQILLCFPLRAL